MQERRVGGRFCMLQKMDDFLVSNVHLALFPGLHTQLLPLAVRKAGEGLDGFIT